MSVFLERFRGRFLPRLDERGMLVVAIMTMGAVGGLAVVFMQALDLQTVHTREKVRSARFSVAMTSALDSVLLAYRLAEIRYNLQVSECITGTVRTFLEAMHEGHGCPSGLADITIFEPGDATASSLNFRPLYSYSVSGGCRITRDSAMTCAGAPLPARLFSMGREGPNRERQLVDGNMFEVTLNRIAPSRSLVEFTVLANPGTPMATQRAFGLRASLPNTAHIEFDGRVTQEISEPLSRCPTEPWATLQLYDPAARRCQAFVQLGGGSGLAFHEGRFFGFRPADGQVIDLLAATTSTSGYLVNESSGAVCSTCPRVFPSYKKDLLLNVDDITTIASQVYYVAQQGPAAHLGAISADGRVNSIPGMVPALQGGGNRVNLCPLGRMGWGYAYNGIGAPDWNDTLLPENPRDPDTVKMGTFLLKTDTRGMLIATVRVERDRNQTTSPNCTRLTFAGRNYKSCCVVFKDSKLQQVEFLRTLGFERTSDSKPYFIY